MPEGSQGQKRPADSIGAAVMVAKIATSEIPNKIKSDRVQSGKAGSVAHAPALSSSERSAIASKAAKARWS